MKDIVKESVRACEFVLNNSSDVNEKINAAARLIGIYNQLEDYEKAAEMTAYLPANIGSWRGFYLASIKNYSEDIESEINQRTINVSMLLNCLYDETLRLGTAYHKSERYEDAIFTYLSMPKIIPAFFPDEDEFYPTLQNCGNNYDEAAFCFLKLGKYDEAIDMLESEVDFMLRQGALSENANQPLSPLLRNCDMKPYKGDMKVYDCLKWILNYLKRYAEYADVLESNPRFKRLLEKIASLKTQ